jgi:hypothetical protein
MSGKKGMTHHEPTPELRKKVGGYAAVGIPQSDIALVLGISIDTLAKHYRQELDTSAIIANGQVGGKLFGKAMAGDTASIIFWCKTKMGWKETGVVQTQALDKNGDPADPPQALTIDLVREMMKKAEDDC